VLYSAVKAVSGGVRTTLMLARFVGVDAPCDVAGPLEPVTRILMLQGMI
jgi:hypothetical protein